MFSEVSTGAENDLEKATALARQMICMYGMSDVVGLGRVAQQRESFMRREGVVERDCSERTAEVIDEEVKKLLNSSYTDAKRILTEHRVQLEVVAQELLKRETLDGAAFRSLIEGSASANGSPAKA